MFNYKLQNKIVVTIADMQDKIILRHFFLIIWMVLMYKLANIILLLITIKQSVP